MDARWTRRLWKIKRIMAWDTLLTYPDFNETFKIHTDASVLQLGAVISQKGKQIAFYSRKLTYAKQRYTVTERELLSIVETLKYFWTILLGQKLRIYTDHKNLTCKIFKYCQSIKRETNTWEVWSRYRIYQMW